MKTNALVVAACSISIALFSSFPSITAMSNFAFTISMRIKTIAVKIPNSAKSKGEQYFGSNKENAKLIICTTSNPENKVLKFKNRFLLVVLAFIYAKVTHYFLAINELFCFRFGSVFGICICWFFISIVKYVLSCEIRTLVYFYFYWYETKRFYFDIAFIIYFHRFAQ